MIRLHGIVLLGVLLLVWLLFSFFKSLRKLRAILLYFAFLAIIYTILTAHTILLLFPLCLALLSSKVILTLTILAISIPSEQLLNYCRRHRPSFTHVIWHRTVEFIIFARLRTRIFYIISADIALIILQVIPFVKFMIFQLKRRNRFVYLLSFILAWPFPHLILYLNMFIIVLKILIHIIQWKFTCGIIDYRRESVYGVVLAVFFYLAGGILMKQMEIFLILTS